MRGPPHRHPEEQREQLPAVEGVILDAAELKAGDRVVYPNQGVCAVVGIEEKDIAGQKLQLVRMRREEDGAAVLVPKNKVPAIGLRRVATGEQMEGVFHYLAASFDEPELDWKVRHRENADRIIAGGVLGVAEVVKGLHSLSRIRPLPTKERELYDSSRHLLVHEIAVSLGVPPVLGEDFVDYALMPPAGVKFALKPPPKPVVLPVRPRRRRPGTEEEDLGLADLGLDGEISGALEGADGGREGAEEGEAEEAAAEPGPAREAEGVQGEKAPQRRAPKRAAAKGGKRAGVAAPAKAPAKKAAARKQAAGKRPAKKPAARKAKPAAKRGGKKK